MHLIWVQHVYIITSVHAWRRKRVARWYIFWWGKWANQPIGRVLPFSQGTTGKSDVILHILQKHRLSTIKNAVSEQILLPNQPHTSNRLRIPNPNEQMNIHNLCPGSLFIMMLIQEIMYLMSNIMPTRLHIKYMNIPFIRPFETPQLDSAAFSYASVVGLDASVTMSSYILHQSLC